MHELKFESKAYRRGRPHECIATLSTFSLECQVNGMNLSPADAAPKGSNDEQRVGNYVVTKKVNLVLGREV